MRGNPLQQWANVVGRELRRKKQTLATAESCTGGLLAQVLTLRPGASDFYWGGVVTYADQSKIALLGVRPSTLKRHGAVSALTARKMALGMARRSGADHTLAITGIAGPSGGSAGKPVGRVYIAWAGGGKTHVWENTFSGSRALIRKKSVQAALNYLRGLFLFD
ncbi:MAG: CinA family protein [Elusimicrobia bacterium]|nr:CinA family protein [Elusimicrobiota bacterium]MBP9698434.1 CinA family protein [Elusimicrobiota bacterium]